MPYAPTETWDLDSLYPGGPGGKPFQDDVESVEAELRDLVRRADALPARPHPADLASVLLHLDRLSERLEMVSTYAGCSIQVLEPDQAARSTMKWDKFRGKDNIKINARFGGFEKSICRDTASGKRCQAGSFTGSVKFNGRYSVPD